MKKYFYLFFFLLSVIVSCQKPDETSDFKFITIAGNKTSSTAGILKIQWQDTKNSSWKIILYNLTDGSKKTIPAGTNSISEPIILGNEYKVVPIGGTIPIDTTNKCAGNTIAKVKIGTMPDLFTNPTACTSSSIYLTNIDAEKTSSTQGIVNFGWAGSGNTSWDLKVTNLTIGGSVTTPDLTATDQSVTFPLDNTQLIELTGKQNGAKKSFKVLVESDENVIISEFY